MGALIQTKGTQRLAKLFNQRFDGSTTGLSLAQTVQNSSGLTLAAAFGTPANDLLVISDSFIAQNAGQNWPADGDDLLYPGATLALSADAQANATQLSFQVPGTAIPASIGAGSAISSIITRGAIPHGTIIPKNAPPALNGNVLTVTISNPLPAKVLKGEMICFSQGKNEQLVRRWRWYLAHDLQAGNHLQIQRAIYNALVPANNCTKISFQTIEDTQRVLVNVQPLTTQGEFDGTYKLDIILMTQQTTAPDQLDPQ
jgi:hypothetical protein